MERYRKISLKLPEGMKYSTTRGNDGELIFELIPDEAHAISEINITFERKEVLEISDVSIDINKDKGKYFHKVTHQDRKKVKHEMKKWIPLSIKNKKIKKFLEEVDKAVQEINYEYWIATMEPSVQNGNIFYAQGENAGIDITPEKWKKMAEGYAPKRGSRLANVHELFLWYAVRIVKGYWSIEEVVNDSSSFGNYTDAPGSHYHVEKTGKKVCGGYSDGQGNTYKLVTEGKHFLLIGGCYYCYGGAYPVACKHNSTSPCCTQKYSVGVVVLTQ